MAIYTHIIPHRLMNSSFVITSRRCWASHLMHTAEEPQEAGEDQVDLILLETANRALNDLWIDPCSTKKKYGDIIGVS